MKHPVPGTTCAAGYSPHGQVIAKIEVRATHEEMAVALAEIAGRYAAMRSQIEPTDEFLILNMAIAKLQERNARHSGH
jgi:hypothetical protein